MLPSCFALHSRCPPTFPQFPTDQIKSCTAAGNVKSFCAIATLKGHFQPSKDEIYAIEQLEYKLAEM